jgi:diketogulonate reductase-like aldo/keto reductase
MKALFLMRQTAQVPHLIYGTAWKKDLTPKYVESAFRHGYRAFDTACQPKHYNEPALGSTLSGLLESTGVLRQDVWIQTKYTPIGGHDLSKPIPYDPNASITDQVNQSFQTSLENLRTDYIDALLLHSPLPKYDQTLEAWKSFESFVEARKVIHIGLSNCYDVKYLQRLYEDAIIKPSVLQNRFYSDSDYDRDIRAFCEDKSIAYQSFWTLTANPDIINSRLVKQLAQKYQKTPQQIFFKFVRHQKIIPLTGTTSDKHMIEDLQVESMQSLAPDEIEAIDALCK